MRPLLEGDREYVGARLRSLLLGGRQFGTGIWSLMQGEREGKSGRGWARRELRAWSVIAHDDGSSYPM